MNRIITILVTIFILLLLYIWISHVWGDDKPRHPRQINDATPTEMSDELMAAADSTPPSAPAENISEQTSNEDEFATERTTDKPVETKSNPVNSEPADEKKLPETKKTEVKSEPAPKKVATPTTVSNKPVSTPPKTETKPVTTASNTEGQHLVIAGNFTQLVNAQQRMQELKKAGFTDAEVINFDLSEYHTVCAGRFTDVNEARKLVKKLKDYHKIDAYVRIGG